MFTLLVIKLQKDTFSHLSDYQKVNKIDNTKWLEKE